MNIESEDRIPTNLRTLLILEALGKQTDAQLPASIGREVGLPKQTVHRLCNTLLSEGFLSCDEKDAGLRPGRRARELAAGILFSSTSHISRHQVLMELAPQSRRNREFCSPGKSGDEL